jgi:hypothetical protein
LISVTKFGSARAVGVTKRESVGRFGRLSLDVSQVSSAYTGFWKIPQFRTEAMPQPRADCVLQFGCTLRPDGHIRLD